MSSSQTFDTGTTHFICYDIPVQAYSCLGVSCRQRLTIFGTKFTSAKEAILLAVVFLSSAAQLECPPVRDSPLWNHIYLHKSGNFICQFLSRHPAAQLKYPPDKEVPLWNHIHLYKRGGFICCGISGWSSSSPTGVSSRQIGTTVKQHPPAQKGQYYLLCFFFEHPAVRLEYLLVLGSPLWNHIYLR